MLIGFVAAIVGVTLLVALGAFVYLELEAGDAPKPAPPAAAPHLGPGAGPVDLAPEPLATPDVGRDAEADALPPLAPPPVHRRRTH